MKRYLVGVDTGGTVSKAAVFDLEGRELSVASRNTALLTPQPGHTERDMEEFWTATAAVIREAVERAGVDPAQIAGVACAGHGKGLYLWGKDGRPACNGIISTDTRAHAWIRAWERDGTAQKAYFMTCQKLLVSQPAALLRWMKQERPEVYGNVQWVFEAKDYIRFRLTGEALGELTDYSGTSLVNLHTRQYDPALFSLFGIAEMQAAMPPLRSSADRCGAVMEEASRLTGLPAGTPVAGGMFDIDACAIACGVTDGRPLCVIAGTWSINEYLSPAPVVDGSVAMNSIFAIPSYYLVEESSPTSAGNLEWWIHAALETDRLQAKAAGKRFYSVLDEMVEALPSDQTDLYYLPYIFGAPDNPQARGCFIGLGPQHQQPHLLRAVYEGVVFCHYAHIRRLLSSRNRPSCIRLAGGAANSAVWVQMFADVCGLPVEIIPVHELGALGCAMSAAVMAGAYPDYQSAAAAMVPVGRQVQPDPRMQALYQTKFDAYARCAAALDPLWERLPTLEA